MTRFESLIMLEKEFAAQVEALASYRGYMYYHTHRSQNSAAGWPDYVFVKLEPEPRFIIAELKTDDLKVSQPSFDQWMWLYVLQHIGRPWGPMDFDTYLWRPSDWDEIVTILR